VSADAGDKLKVLLTKKRSNSKKTKATAIKAISGKKVLKAVGAECAKFRPDLKVRDGYLRRRAQLRAAAQPLLPLRQTTAASRRSCACHRAGLLPRSRLQHSLTRACRTPPCDAPLPCRRACA
jgi:hypothetical protein